MRSRRPVFGLSLLLLTSAGPALPVGAITAPITRTAVVRSLPQDRLHFGVTNDSSNIGWMTSSGVPWRYRYQYLAGGVNTPNPWQNWDSPTGAFATNYMNASSANGYIPVFTYYELLQSNPSVGANESDRDFSNLNNASTMAAYYANFKLLMQVAGAYGKPVVVHVEPDLWGYLEQRAAGGSAALLSASVASSGFTDVASLPNTAQGYAFALLKMRDTYGPNVILAIHASPWGSGIDIASDRSSTVNPIAEADTTTSFLNSAGIGGNPYGSTWDLVFNDLDDHDAGWWEQQGADNAYFTHWWDPTNQIDPNFTRYLAWVAELKTKTGRPQIAWQVPVGNQYFLTMNNTCGHYQDNVAPYFISHPSDLFSAGLIAVLFGAGNSCQTTYTDARTDGVTNNGGAPTTDSLGHCNACNTHPSVWPDDDGGFLRIFVGQYYAGWKSAGGALVSAPAIAASTSGYDVFIRGSDNGLWLGHFSGGTFTGWTALDGVLGADPAVVQTGSTRIDVFIRGQEGGVWQRTWDGSTWRPWQSLGGVILGPPSAVSLSSNRIDVFVRGQEGGLWQRTWDGTAWGGWQLLGGLLTAAPVAAVSGGNRIDVFHRGTDYAIWERSWTDTSGWGGFVSLGGYLPADPVSVIDTSGRIDIFARGWDSGLWQDTWNGSAWIGWTSHGGVMTYPPAAVSCSGGHLDTFEVGTDHGIWRVGFNGGWSAWQSLGGDWSSAPAPICRPGTNTIDLFERGADAALWYGFSLSGS